MKIRKRKLALGLGLGALGLGFYINRQCFYANEKKITLYSPKIEDPIKITHITDFHSNVLSNLGEVIENIRQFAPDFIILTGDILDYGTDRKIERSLFFLKHLSSLGIETFYITGNHEEIGPNLDYFLEELEKLGIKYLKNESVLVKDNKINLYGNTFYTRSFEKYKNYDDKLNIILSHYSKHVRDRENVDFDFVFSGHTHGGQVRFPILGALVSPGEGFFPSFDKGIYPYRNGIIYVDSGLGNTFLPLRFLNKIEYSNIEIKNGSVV